MIDEQQILAIARIAAHAFEIAGIAAIASGALFALARLGLHTIGRRAAPEVAGERDAVAAFRRGLARSILTASNCLSRPTSSSRSRWSRRWKASPCSA